MKAIAAMNRFRETKLVFSSIFIAVYHCIANSIKQELPIRNVLLDINGFVGNWKIERHRLHFSNFILMAAVIAYFCVCKKKWWFDGIALHANDRALLHNASLIRISASRTLVVCILCNVASEAAENGLRCGLQWNVSVFSACAASECRHTFLSRTRRPAPSIPAKVLYCNVIWIYHMRYASDHQTMWCGASLLSKQFLHKSKGSRNAVTNHAINRKGAQLFLIVIFGKENMICSVSLASYLFSGSHGLTY